MKISDIIANARAEANSGSKKFNTLNNSAVRVKAQMSNLSSTLRRDESEVSPTIRVNSQLQRTMNDNSEPTSRMDFASPSKAEEEGSRDSMGQTGSMTNTKKDKPKKIYDPKKDIDRFTLLQGTALGASIKKDKKMTNRQLKKQLTMASAAQSDQKRRTSVVANAISAIASQIKTKLDGGLDAEDPSKGPALRRQQIMKGW